MRNLALSTFILTLYTLFTNTLSFGDAKQSIQKRQLIIFPMIQVPRKVSLLRLNHQYDDDSSFGLSNRFLVNGVKNQFQASSFFRKNQLSSSTFKPINSDINFDDRHHTLFDKQDNSDNADAHKLVKTKSSSIKSSQFNEKFESFFGKSSTEPTTTTTQDPKDGKFFSLKKYEKIIYIHSNEENEASTTTTATTTTTQKPTTTEESVNSAVITNNNNNLIISDSSNNQNANINNNNVVGIDKSVVINNNNNNLKSFDSDVTVNINNNNLVNSGKEVTNINNNNNNVQVDEKKINKNINFNNNNIARFGGVTDFRKSFARNNVTSSFQESNKQQSRRTINININNNNGIPEKRATIFSTSSEHVNNNNNNVVITGSNSGTLNLHNENGKTKNDTNDSNNSNPVHDNANNAIGSKIFSGIRFVFDHFIGKRIVKKRKLSILDNNEHLESENDVHNNSSIKSFKLSKFARF